MVNKVSITSYLSDFEQDAKLSELQISYLWTGNNNTYFTVIFMELDIT